MGTVIHEATLVTTFDPAMAIAAHREAERIFPSSMVTAIELSPINKYNTFVILPCGSKEGWPDKARDKADRTAFLDWVKGQAYEDGSNALEIGSVRYGNDLPTPAAVTIQVTCECGEQLCHEIECEEDDFGGWSAAPEGRFILCEACERLIDAGLQISIGVPA